MSVTHRIRRQRWQLTAASQAEAFAARVELRHEHELSLLAALESAFDAVDDKRRDLHLPRLDIAVRISSLENLAAELPSRLAEAARQALTESFAVLPDSVAPQRQVLTPADRLRRYLHAGQLDWFDAGRESAQQHRLLADEAALWSSAPVDAWDRLLGELPQDTLARRDALLRFLQLLNATDRARWWDIARRLAASGGGRYATALAALRELQAGRPEDHGLRLQSLGLLLLADVAQSRHGTDTAWRAAAQPWFELLGPLPTTERALWRHIDALPGGEAPGLTRPATVSSHSTAAADNPAPVPLATVPAPGLPLRSAGLLLLHPYLPRLFSALGWVAANPRRGEPFPWASLPRAAAFLNWLATGRDEPLEYELGTAKLLLGLHPGSPLPVASGLVGAVEQLEGEALLEAVIQHWPALGKTRVDGLRVVFLQRGGLLYPAADGWLLRLQAESFDVLLDRLPWGIATVRLPWLPFTVHSEWSRA